MDKVWEYGSGSICLTSLKTWDLRLKNYCSIWGLHQGLQSTHALVSYLGCVMPSLLLPLSSQNITAVILGKLPFSAHKLLMKPENRTWCTDCAFCEET